MMAQIGEQPRHLRFCHFLAGVETVRNVEMTGSAPIPDKGWRSSCHVGADHRRGIIEEHGPPRLAMLGNVAFIGTLSFGPPKELFDNLPLWPIYLIQVNRKVDYALKANRIPKFVSCSDDFSGL